MRSSLSRKRLVVCIFNKATLLTVISPRSNLIPFAVDGALEWLEKNQEKSIDDIKAAEGSASTEEGDANAEPPALKEGEVARSLVCNECGKRFRSTAQAEFHASKT